MGKRKRTKETSDTDERRREIAERLKGLEVGRKVVQAEITIRSRSGRSIHEERVTAKNVREFHGADGFREHILRLCKSLGLGIVASNRITVAVRAPAEAFEGIFGVELEVRRFFPYIGAKSQMVPDEKGCGVDITYKGGKRLPIPKELDGLVDAIHLATPMSFCALPDPPTPDYFHLDVPYDVARLVDAIQCHARGFTGAGVKLVMPDQGTFDHPYYTERGYDITLDESAYDGTADDGSHGTAIAANALAVAPGVEFVGVRNGKKITSGTAAFIQSVEHDPDVISISWGTTSDVADLRAAIIDAIVTDNIFVCCACGNGGTLVFPSSILEVMSVGGAYANDEDRLEASTYASSGVLADVDPDRQMPDMVGLVGEAPHGIYITLPCHDGSDEDTAFGGGTFPEDDETAVDDGWIVASGTSSATPQVAAAACLLIESAPEIYRDHPDRIRTRLLVCATDVTLGASANGQPAAPGVNDACGSGMVDAYVAVNHVDVWIRDHAKDRGLVRSRGAHWMSPDIKILASPLGDPEGGFPSASHVNRPEWGRDYYVYIAARNRGDKATENVSVGFYFADPSTFISYPSDWNDGQTGVAANGSITVDGNPTNQFLLDGIAAGGVRVAGPFVWSPPLPTVATQVIVEGTGRQRGHFCLLARLDCADDTILNPAGTESTVWLDNNVGMKNTWVIEPGLTFPLTLKSPPHAKFSTLVVDTRALPRGLRLQVRIPKSMLVDVDLGDLGFRPAEAQRGVGYIEIPSGKLLHVDIRAGTKAILSCRMEGDLLGIVKRDAAAVHFEQLVSGRSLGGASVLVRPKTRVLRD